MAAWTDVSLCDVALKDSTADYGGGGWFAGGNVELRNVLVSGNNAGDQGGGLYFGEGPRAGSRHFVTDCNLVGNQAGYVGGGIVGYYVKIFNSHLENNFAWGGGGAYLEAQSTANECSIISNRADCGGGLMLAVGAAAKRCMISDNVANLEGGGVRMWLAPSAIQDCKIVGNRSEVNGGGIYAFWGTKVIGCEIKGNHAIQGVGGGAALCGPPGGTFIQNSLVLSNTAVRGGGLWLADATVQNCTIVGNSGSISGGGVHCVNGGTVENTIIFSNRSLTGSNYYNDGQGWSYSYCRVTPAIQSGPGNMDADPRFADPGHWDPNSTLDALDDDFWVDGDYHLKSQAGRWDPKAQTWVKDNMTSPCIDAGDPNSDWTAELWPHGKRINMGAYGGTAEASMSLSVIGNPADHNNDNRVDSLDLLLLSQEWLNNHLPLAGDINHDAKVDWVDFAIMALNWLEDNSG
jgi:hypothetical protein